MVRYVNVFQWADTDSDRVFACNNPTFQVVRFNIHAHISTVLYDVVL